MIKKKFILPLIFLVFLLELFVAGNAFSKIVSSRPRVWIDDTIQSTLQERVTNDTESWQKLKGWCDSKLGANLNQGYRGSGWWKAVLNYGLCFQATGDQTYGNEGVIYLTALIDDHYKVGDGLGGNKRFANDDGNGNAYVSRFVGVGTAVGRDWLDGATNLNQSLINRIGARVKYWLNYLVTNPKGSVYAMGDPNDNFFSGHFSFFHTAAISFYGDTNYQQSWRTQADTMWNSLAKPNIINHLKGGDWQEGWNYGPLAVRGQLLYMWGLTLAETNPPDFSDISWVEELIKSHLHGLSPNRKFFHDNGSWTGSTKGDPRDATMLLLLQMTSDNNLAKRGAWYSNIISGGTEAWEYFLWDDSSITPTIPTSSFMGGLAYKIEGTSRMFTRSDNWTNLNSTWLEFACPPSGSASQDETNVGEFKITSRGKKLIVDADTYQSASSYANVLLINGSHTYAPLQEWWRDNVHIDRYENQTGFTYARGSELENAYDAKKNNDPSASFYSREILFIRPDYIFVMDSMIPTNESINTIAASQIHFHGKPVINGSTAQAVNGNAKIFMDVRGHAVNLTQTDVSGSIIGTVHKVKIIPTSTSPNYKLLHIFQTADATTATMDTVSDIITEKMQGVQIGETVALFNKSPSLIDITGNITYTISGTVNTHILTGLTPGKAYSMSQSGNTITLSNGTGYTVSNDGVLYISETSEGEKAPNILQMSNN